MEDINMEVIKLRDEFIKLGQALKAANLVGSGVEAKMVIQDGEVCTQRGKKLSSGDTVTFADQTIKIEE